MSVTVYSNPSQEVDCFSGIGELARDFWFVSKVIRNEARSIALQATEAIAGVLGRLRGRANQQRVTPLAGVIYS